MKSFLFGRSRSRSVGGLLLILMAGGVLGGVACNRPADPPAPTTSEQSYIPHTLRVTAGETSLHLLNVVAWDISVAPDASGTGYVTVQGIDANGSVIGELTVSGNSNAPMAFAAPDGSTATAQLVRSEPGFLSRDTVTYRAAGASLAITQERWADDPTQVIYESWDDAIGVPTTVSVPAGTSAEDSAAAVSAWANGNAQITAIGESTAGHHLFGMLLDPSWALGAQTLLGLSTGNDPYSGGIGKKTAELHKSGFCSSALPLTAFGVACGACAGFVIALAPGVLTGPGEVAVIIGTVATCAGCVVAGAASFVQAVTCGISEYYKKTPQACMAAAPAWADGQVTPDEHSCFNVCNADKCNAYCSQSGQVSNSCMGNSCTCTTTGGGGTGGGGSGGSSGTGGYGGGPSCACFGTCSRNYCLDGSHIDCTGPCPPDYECEFGACTKVTVTILDDCTCPPLLPGDPGPACSPYDPACSD